MHGTPRSNRPGGPWGPQSQGPRPRDVEEFLRLGQDKLRGLLPGNLGGRGVALIALAAVAVWGFSGFFRVEPDELGVSLSANVFDPCALATSILRSGSGH